MGLESSNLKNDPGETRNLADAHPEVIARLENLAEKARVDLEDDLTGRPPTHTRPAGSLN